MKNRLIIAGLLLFTTWAARACDICGCAGAGTYMGILPQFQKNFMGLRLYSSAFLVQHPPSILTAGNVFSHERSVTTELWGRFYPHKRVQVLGFVPYMSHTGTENNVTTTVRGLGDATVLANYTLLNTADSIYVTYKQTLQAGGGLVLPTGRYSSGGDVSPTMQPGSGSMGYVMNAIYTLRYQRTGINANAMYTVNTSNNAGYRFGNRLTGSLRLFYWHRYKKASLLPSAGVQYERAAKDVSEGYYQRYSGGNALFATAGADVYWKRLTFGISGQLPLAQNLGEGYINAKGRVQASFAIIF